MANQSITLNDLKKIHEYLYEIPETYRTDMRVSARIFANQEMLQDIIQDRSLWQLVNVTTLPGIIGQALAMPDIHQGYGFPIGGVAAMDLDGGVISPGGIGYDINCGMRLLKTPLQIKDVHDRIEDFATALYRSIPSGVGAGGKLELKGKALDDVLRDGAQHMLKLGYGVPEDVEFCEERGRLAHADPSLVSERAKMRGADQLGTLGSGNHFLEVQRVEEIFDATIAQTFGLFQDQIVIMIHCGSRGLGHQTCTDYVRTMVPLLAQRGIEIPDRELACAPFYSDEGQAYFKAMAAAANFAWANRHLIGHRVRQAVQAIFGDVAVTTLYDVSHNIGKIETHRVGGHEKQVLVHRKGATRAFGPQHPDVCAAYRAVGQPVLIPGTMGTASYVLAGGQEAMNVSFGSACHGAGRKMSRAAATKMVGGAQLRQELQARGITIRCRSDKELSEEAPAAYKDVDSVVNIIHAVGIARKVVKLRPVAVIKG